MHATRTLSLAAAVARPCNGNCAGLGELDASELTGFVDATAVNDLGDVVGQISGTLTNDRRLHAGIWENGVTSDLGMVGESHLPSPFGSPYYGYWAVYYAHEAIFQNGQAT